MNNIQLNIIANAQFQQVYAEVAKLKEAMLGLQQASVGGPFTPSNIAGIKQAQTAFDNAVLSTRAFNIETVAMGSNIEKFGKQLQSGQLTLNQYYKIWRDSSKGVSTELDNLATSQARLNRSIAIADPLRPGYAKLVTDINGVVTAQEKATFYQQALNTALNQGATKLIDFGKNMQWAGRQMTVGLTVPLSLFASQAASAYLSFDKQMTDMLKVYGSHAVVQSQQALDTIRTQVTSLAENLAHTIGVTMTDTVTIAKTFSAIGLEGQDLIKTTSATATLMKLGNLQATDAANAMVSLQNVFKIQSDQMQNAVNFLNAAKHSTSTTMEDMIAAIPRVGPIITQMGGTYKDFVTLLVALKENGVPAAQGANAIKSMFASLENPTTKAIGMFNNLGISLKGIVARDQNSPLQMVLDLQKALDGLPSLTRQQAIEQLFGKFQFARVEALLNSLGKAGSQNAKVLELYGQSNDQLAAVAKQEIDISSNKTPAAQYAKMKASLQADLIPMGQTFLQIMTKLGNIVDGIVRGFNHLGAAGKVLAGALIFVGLTGPIIMLTGLLSNFVGQMLKGANYVRMFKEGMENATPSQNKFLAGIHNLTNFYQDLDKETIAARNQLELMPEAITSNAQAFAILGKAIQDLTAQFTALTAAQREAMGFGVAGESMQMIFPGFANGIVNISGGTPGRDSIPAMIAPGESVMTAAATAKFSPILSAMNKGSIRGYMGGQINFGDRSLLLSGQQKSIERLSAAFSEESPLSIALKTQIFEYLNTLANASGVVRVNLTQLTKDFQEQSAALQSASLYRLPSEKGTMAWYSASHHGVKRPIEKDVDISGAYASELEAAKYGVAQTSSWASGQGITRSDFSVLARNHVFAFPKEIAGYAGSFNPLATVPGSGAVNQLSNMLASSPRMQSQYLNSLNQSNIDEETKASIQSKILNNQELSHKELIKQKEVLDLMLQNEQDLTDIQKQYISGAKQYASGLDEYWNIKRQTAQTEQELAQIEREYNAAGVRTREQLQIAIEQLLNSAQNLSNLGPRLTAELQQNAEGAFADFEAAIRQQAQSYGLAVPEALLAGVRDAWVMHSPSQKAYDQGFLFAQSEISGIESQIPEAVAAGSQLGAAGIIGMESTSAAAAAGSLAAPVAEAGLMSRIAGSKFAIGGGAMAASAFLPMLTNMIPNKIGGADVSGAKTVLSDVTQGASMGAMGFLSSAELGPLGVPVGVVTTAIGAVVGLFNGITSMINANKQKVQTAVENSITSVANMLSTSPLGSAQASLNLLALNQKSVGSAKGQQLFEQTGRFTGEYVIPTGTKPIDYAKMSKDLKDYGDNLTATFNLLQNVSGFDNLKKQLDGINTSTQKSQVATAAFASTIINQGGPMADKFNLIKGKIDLTKTSVGDLMTILYATMFADFDPSKSTPAKLLDNALAKIKEIKKTLGQTGESGNANGFSVPTITNPPDYNKMYKPYLDQSKGLLKLAQDQANAQKKYNDELKATQQYHTQQLDYLNQMKNALTSGNYLGALQAQQSAQANQADYLANLQQAKQSDLVTYLQNRVAMFQDAAGNQLTPAQMAAQNKGFQLTLSKDAISKLFGMTDIKYGGVTSAVTAKTAALEAQAMAGASGAVFGDINITINGTNLSQAQLTDAMVNTLTTIQTKNNSSQTRVSGTGAGKGKGSAGASTGIRRSPKIGNKSVMNRKIT